ncbi:hypothetical protein DFH11DRAFT_1688810 [Phellopilus nigrolimitatus]|nr:hypothetical protein DFH11DRAFT_1688810 [Phellopilus nigrolimitatus]
MSAPSEAQLKALKTALIDTRPPYCAGTLPLPVEDFILFYGKDKSGSRLDFCNATDEDVKHLADTCDAATFGRNQEDVLDESYRKAGKLDTAHFSTNIDVERSGLMNAIRYDLLEGHDGRRPIKAELYKLNVYGKDSFFKAHQDTPRSTTMFGSLVIVFPTPHEGGALILRHDNKEWTFDSAQALAETSSPHAHIGYIAFFSDVEHEVTTVKSGYRVTLTYNLHYDDDAAFANAQILKTLPMNESAVKTALQALLEDDTFLSEGGYLGFGLRHEYPIELKPEKADTVTYLASCLKGSDAVLMKACRELGLNASLNLFYRESQYRARYEMIVGKEPKVDGRSLHDDEKLWEHLRDKYDASLVKSGSEYEEADFSICWVTERTPFNALKATYIAYGNQAETKHAYGRFCLVVDVGPTGERGTVE